MGSRDFVNMIKTSQGFVGAEDIIGVRNPNYNEDNVFYETMKYFRLIPQISLTGDGRDIGAYELASRRFIKNGLAQIR